MSVAAPPPASEPHPTVCENCGTALQGDYCHACGQSTHSPVRHVGHAVEEVFESFWHLDGRIFRTLRELCVPGRIAERYLAGHRVRYVAPMRLMVILTLLTFFVAKFVVQDAMAEMTVDDGPRADQLDDSFARADTVAEVKALRDETLASLAETRKTTGAFPGVTPQLDRAEAAVRAAAAERITALGGDATAPAETAAASSSSARVPPTLGGPVGERIERNLERLSNDPQVYVRAVLGVAPTTLFILVPLFAVMLKLLYLFQGRLYLEHVVVGLYSHAALMLGLLLVLAGSLVTPWLAMRAAWAAGTVGWLQTVLLWAMPVYLLLMQKRVYRQSWPWTLLKFAVIGQLYLALFLSVAIPMAGYALYAL